MLIFNITRRINKAVAPKFLSWSLRLHESLSSSSSLPFSPNAISMLPLAQRLVSIEVQDDYRQLIDDKNNSSTSSAWENFVDQSWNLFFEERHQKSKGDEQVEVEAEAQRLWEVKQQKRQQRQQHRASSIKGTKETQYDNDQNKELLELGEQRVQLLEKYIRPALGSSGDVNRHLFTHHDQNNNSQSTDSYDNFTKWIRGEYLVAKYGLAVQKAVRHHPELRDDAAGLSTLEVETEDAPLSNLLPSVNTIREAFGMQDWSRDKVSLSSWGDEEDNLPSDGDANDEFAIEQIIHNNLHGQIAHSGPLNAYFEMRRREDSYELWTREYIFGMAQYLLDRIAEMDRDTPTETIILDVGAGDGRLVHFLRRAMKEINLQHKPSKKKKKIPEASLLSQHSNLPTIIATDDGSWKAPIYNNRHIQVEQLSAIESLDKYGPKPDEQEGSAKTRLIVLCSWMPPEIDFSADFRRPLDTTNKSVATGDESVDGVERLVEEYILIGEADDGTCGHNWYTWGNHDFHTEDDDESKNSPHVMDGYTRVDLEELSSLQFSRFDCKRSSESKTVSFRRAGQNGQDS